MAVANKLKTAMSDTSSSNATETMSYYYYEDDDDVMRYCMERDEYTVCALMKITTHHD